MYMTSLEDKWAIRSYLNVLDDISADDRPLIDIAVSSFVYLNKHRKSLQRDRSLRVICQLCTDKEHAWNVSKVDNQLRSMANLFNKLIQSNRALYMCYDCGTVARGVFIQLIKEYRGRLVLSSQEVKRMKGEYYMSRYDGIQGINVLSQRVKDTQEHSLFLCSIQTGDTAGHVYIIEKYPYSYYRIYQSCLNSYLLIDYLEHMDYLAPNNEGVDVMSHIQDLKHLVSHKVWGSKEVDMFKKWFHFTPIHAGRKTFTSTYIIL